MKLETTSSEVWGSGEVRQASYSSSNIETVEDLLDYFQNVSRVAGFGEMRIGRKLNDGGELWSKF